MKRLLLIPILALAACSSEEPEPKAQQTPPTSVTVPGTSGTPLAAAPAAQQNHGNDWLLWGLLGYMWGSSMNQPRTETRYVTPPSQSAVRQSEPARTSSAPSYVAPKPSTPPSSTSHYSSGSSSRSTYSSGSSSSYSGSRSSGSSYSGGRR